jgi:hypothetical protein
MIKSLTYVGPSLAELHTDYAKQRRIDGRAPIAGREVVEVDAPVGVVWQVLSDVAAWATSLEPGVRDINLPEGVRVDASFTRVAGGARMRARFAVVDPERELAWTGSSFGLKAVHRFVLEPLSATSTLVVIEESMAGAPLAALFTTDRLCELLRRSLCTLKAAAEEKAR